MNDLLEVDIGIASMADIIAEIFTGAPELCLKVREDQIAKIFTLIAQKELPQGRPELLYALQVMVKVGTCLHHLQYIICIISRYKGGEFRYYSEEKSGIYRYSLFQDKRTVL